MSVETMLSAELDDAFIAASTPDEVADVMRCHYESLLSEVEPAVGSLATTTQVER